MGNYYLASVGTANAFVKKTINDVEGIYHAFSSKTLTESTIGITSSSEEVRAGDGAKLYGRFNHTTGFNITLTEAMFKLEYLAMQVGAEIKSNGANVMFTETLAYNNGFALSKVPAFFGSACGLNYKGVWFREAGCDATDDVYFINATNVSGQTVTSDDAARILAKNPNAKFCVSYFTEEEAARSMMINANFIPAEFMLIITTKLFAGDANNPESGHAIGEITVKVPRFQLNGTMDLSMAMAGAATVSLEGTALAAGSDSCDGDGVYAEIVELIKGRKWYDGMVNAFKDAESTADYYGVFNGGYTSLLDDSSYEIVTKADGKYLTIKEGTVVVKEFKVEDAE